MKFSGKFVLCRFLSRELGCRQTIVTLFFNDPIRYLFKIKADVNKTTNDKVWCPLKIAAYVQRANWCSLFPPHRTFETIDRVRCSGFRAELLLPVQYLCRYRGFTATVRTLVELKADANSVSSALELSGSSSEIREILQAAAQAAPKPSEDSK